MGGDRGEEVVIEAAQRALDAGLGPLILTGTEQALEKIPPELKARIETLTADEFIGMSESPARAARAKKQSSMHLGMRAVRDQRAAAFVTAGNSGAALAVGILTLKRLKGCDRPAIASVLPTATGEVVLLDLGANTEVRPAQFAQFAVLGAAYASLHLGIERPRIGLLSNGTELTKGTDQLRDAHQQLSVTDLNYLGFVEGNDLPLGRCDVVVTDGFVGNVALKLSEGVIEGARARLRTYFQSSWKRRLLGRILQGALRDFASEIDWRQFGGAPLLGVNGVVILSHGRADAQALCEAIRCARISSQRQLTHHIQQALESSPYHGNLSSTSELTWMRPSEEE
jgi:glycerol-3-phosphate acyltransferase PlsX